MGFEVDRDGDPARLCDVRQSLDASLHMELLSARQPLAMGNAEGTLEEEEDEEKREERGREERKNDLSRCLSCVVDTSC